MKVILYSKLLFTVVYNLFNHLSTIYNYMKIMHIKVIKHKLHKHITGFSMKYHLPFYVTSQNLAYYSKRWQLSGKFYEIGGIWTIFLFGRNHIEEFDTQSHFCGFLVYSFDFDYLLHWYCVLNWIYIFSLKRIPFQYFSTRPHNI